ncbi:MAG: C39 family peptidase [Vulcanimicrobiaceae bacterium]
MLSLIRNRPAGSSLLRVPPATEAVITWTCDARAGELGVCARFADGSQSARLPYVSFSANARRSFSPHDGEVTLEVDVLRSSRPFVALEIDANVPLATLAASVPVHRAARVDALPASGVPSAGETLPAVDVPARSQYLDGGPRSRTWCLPATLGMLLAHAGVERSLPELAAALYDDGYGATGNWAFAIAHGGAHGLAGAAFHLRNLAHAATFTRAGIPLALSISWKEGALPGAPLAHSDGHLVVLRGFDPAGDPLLNDPAAQPVATRYPREPFERAWLGHGGIALALVRPDRAPLLVRLANR